MTAPRPKVVQTTKPTIKADRANRETGGDMTRGVGSARTNTGCKPGKTPGTKASRSGYAASSMVDEGSGRYGTQH